MRRNKTHLVRYYKALVTSVKSSKYVIYLYIVWGMNFKYSMFQRDMSNAARSLICQSSKLHSIEIFHVKRLILQNDQWGVEVVNRKSFWIFRELCSPR